MKPEGKFYAILMQFYFREEPFLTRSDDIVDLTHGHIKLFCEGFEVDTVKQAAL